MGGNAINTAPFRIIAGMETGIGGIASSASYYNQLSADLTNDIEQAAKSTVTMQAAPAGLPSISGPPRSDWVGFIHY
jgi:hypothetical protein